MSVQAQTAALLAAVTSTSHSEGVSIVANFETKSQLILSWIDYFETEETRHTCDELLIALRASLLEAAACLSLGLVRSSVYAIRLELELLLAWLYFNDHPVEWSKASTGGTDFPLRKQNLSYLERYSTGFDKRFELLKKNSKRTNKDPYHLLSTFVHGSAIHAMPGFENLAEVVQDSGSIQACLSLQEDVAEYLSDVASCWFYSKWHDLPELVRADLSARLNAAQLKTFTQPS